MTRRFACALACASILGCGGGHDGAGTEPEPCVAPTVTAYESKVPPARPAATSAGGGRRWFAIATLQLGVTNAMTAAPDPNAWKDFGFDLDARDTTFACGKTIGESCTRRPGSPTAVLADGNGGVDNALGARMVPNFKALHGDVEDLTNKELASGHATWILRLDDVGDDDDAHVPGAIYLAGALGSPTFTEADRWPVVATSLDDRVSIDRPRVSFPNGYIVGGTWVSGPPDAAQTLPLLPIIVLPNGDLVGSYGSDLVSFRDDCPPGTYGMFCENKGDPPPPPPPRPAPTSPPRPSLLVRFPFERPILSVNVHDGRGTIAAVLRDRAVRDAFTGIWPKPPSPPSSTGAFLCGEPSATVTDFVIDALTIGSDLVADAPSLQDPGVTCDSISVGLGFTMKPTGAPSVVVPDTFTPFPQYEPIENTLDDGIDNDCDGKADGKD